jgi:hypothetical protein
MKSTLRVVDYGKGRPTHKKLERGGETQKRKIKTILQIKGKVDTRYVRSYVYVCLGSRGGRGEQPQ